MAVGHKLQGDDIMAPVQGCQPVSEGTGGQ